MIIKILKQNTVVLVSEAWEQVCEESRPDSNTAFYKTEKNYKFQKNKNFMSLNGSA